MITSVGVSYCVLEMPFAARTNPPVLLVVTVFDDANIELNCVVPASSRPLDAVRVMVVFDGKPYTGVVAEI